MTSEISITGWGPGCRPHNTHARTHTWHTHTHGTHTPTHTGTRHRDAVVSHAAQWLHVFEAVSVLLPRAISVSVRATSGPKSYS